MQGDGLNISTRQCGEIYWRHEHKGKPIEDLDKAIWFLNKLKDTYEK